MTLKQQESVLKDFIMPFLAHSGDYFQIYKCFFKFKEIINVSTLTFPRPGPRCVSISNNSADWLTKSLGPFSQFLTVKKMFELNPRFKPVLLNFL